MTAITALQSVASLAGGRIINCVVEGVLVALLAWALLRVSACRNSGTRFAVWFSALVAIGGLSITSLVIRGATVTGTVARSRIALPVSWVIYGFLIWAIIAAFGVARVLTSLWQVWSLRRRSRVLADGEIDPLLRQTIADFSLRRVSLRVCDDLRVPAALGFFSPAVIIPRWALQELSPGELNSVLLHELGHLRRWDDWSNLAQKLLRALLFFHPAVWWIDSRLTLEREMACDDLVLAKTVDSRGYAQCLVSVAEKSLLRTGLALALAAVGRMRQTAARLTRILDPNRSPETRVSKPVLACVSAIAIAALIALPYTPTLVVFQNGTSAASAASSMESFKQAHVVEATLDPRSMQAHVVPAVLGRGFAKPQSKFPSLIETKVKNSAEGSGNRGVLKYREGAVRPKVVKTAFSETKSARNIQNRSNQAVLVFVQAEEFDAVGTPVWSVRVLRLTFSPSKKQIQSLNGTNASSI